MKVLEKDARIALMKQNQRNWQSVREVANNDYFLRSEYVNIGPDSSGVSCLQIEDQGQEATSQSQNLTALSNKLASLEHKASFPK